MLPAEKNMSQKWLVREECETDWEYGQRPEKRDVRDNLENGLVVLDKPSGIKSHKLSVDVKKKLKRGKAGHSGTLDPGVTGVLPVGLNKGTKVLQALKNAGKEYYGSMKLGEEFGKEKIKEVAESFVGTVKQLPPEISAVKREEREREVYEIEVLGVDGEKVEFRIECEKGFYVRTFCKQFGEKLGTEGEMVSLRRTKVGLFQEKDMVEPDKLFNEFQKFNNREDNSLKDHILPVEAGVKHLKKILLKDTAVSAVCHGAELGSMGVSKLQEGIEKGEEVALLTLKGELVAIGVAEMASESIVSEKGTAASLKRVFMDKKTYPKKW